MIRLPHQTTGLGLFAAVRQSAEKTQGVQLQSAGSAFAGLTANSPWWNTTLGLAMLLGRFPAAIAILAIAGSMAAKPKLAPTAGAMPTDTGQFAGLLVGVILILGGLQFFPALALGPIVEHFQVLQTMAGL